MGKGGALSAVHKDRQRTKGRRTKAQTTPARHSGTQHSQAREHQLTLNRPRSPAEALEPTRAPTRPRGRRRREPSRAISSLVRFLSGVLTVALVVIGGIGAFAALLSHQFDVPGPLEATRTFAIPKGEGRIATASRLEREGIISNRWSFVAGHILQGFGSDRRNTDLKAGEYEIKKGATMRQVIDTLVEGKSVLSRLTIPEGLTSQQIVERIMADPNLTGEITEIPAEGSLMPDTYRYSKGMTRQEFIERMQAEQQRFLVGLWEKRAKDLPAAIASIEHAIILASIVEKETARADERERVAAVFVNRLRKGMRLQSDPTIIYGIVGGKGSLGRPITRSDIDTKTAYNTYTIDGLPPTPICNPGRSAIEATLNPADTTDLFFVADGTGGHTFSDTLKEHNAAVQTWRKVEREMRVKQDQAQRAASRAAPQPNNGAEAALPVPENTEPPPDGAAAAAVRGAASVPLPVRKPKKN